MQLTFNTCDFNLKKKNHDLFPFPVALLIFFLITSMSFFLSTSEDILFVRSGASSDSGTHIGSELSLLSPNNDVVSAFYAY